MMRKIKIKAMKEKKSNGLKNRMSSQLLGDLLELESNVKYAWHVDWPCKARFR